MPVGMSLRWPGMTLAQYDALMPTLELDDDPPAGGLIHFAGELNGELRVFDVWDSGEQFQSFVESRLTPATEAAGIEGEPQVEIFPLHNVWTPAPERVAELAGGSSLPA